MTASHSSVRVSLVAILSALLRRSRSSLKHIEMVETIVFFIADPDASLNA